MSVHDNSPFQGLTYELAVEATIKMIQDTLTDRYGDNEDEPERHTHDHPVRSVLLNWWHGLCEGFRGNRYRLPVAVYVCLFIVIFLTAFINMVMAVLRGFESGQPKVTEMRGGQCEHGFQNSRAYRTLFEGVTTVLPHLVTMVLFLFPALYRT